MSKPPIYVIMDERIDQLDERLCRVIFAAVETSSSLDLHKYGTELEKETKYSGKFHFTDIAEQKEKTAIVDSVAKMGLYSKVYTYYEIGEQATVKQNGLKWAIREEMRDLMKKYRPTFLIEHANEYNEIIKMPNLIDGSSRLTIFPDVVCAVFAARLDYDHSKSRHKDHECVDCHRCSSCMEYEHLRYGQDLDRYQLLRETIRKQAFLSKGGKPIYKSRGNRI